MNDQFVPTTVEQHVQRMADNAWAAGMLDAVGTFAERGLSATEVREREMLVHALARARRPKL